MPFKKNLFVLIRNCFHPSFKVYRFLTFKGIFNVKVEQKKFLIRHYGFYVENELFWKGLTSGKWEAVSMKLWIQLCKRSQNIFDIGANTGVYALVAQTLQTQAQVYAFEPIPRTYKKLTDNCRINKYPIHCEELALSNTNDQVEIFDPLTAHNYLATLQSEVAEKQGLTQKITIQAHTLTGYIEAHKIPRIDLMKIDVEGHEPAVLEGMGKYLKTMRPTMLMEINSDDVGAAVQHLLEGMDYLFFNINEQDMPRKVDQITKSDFNNYLICDQDTAKYLDLIKE